MSAEKNIPQIIDELYAGALDEAAWDRAMIATADLVRGTGALLLGVNPTTGDVFRDDIHRFDPLTVASYRKVWAAKDERIGLATQMPLGEVAFESKLLPVRRWQSSEIYNEFLIPADAPWFLSTWLHKSSDKLVALSIEGSRRRGPFDVADSNRIKPLLAHIRRTLEIKDRLELAQLRRDSLVKSLDSMSLAAIFLDHRGKILEASASAFQLLRPNCSIRRNSDGTMWLREPAGKELNQWIATGTPPSHNQDGLLHIPRPLAKPLSVMVTRLPEASTSWFRQGPPFWMLLVFDPERRLPVSANLIARDLGISEREAQVAALLFEGYDVKHAARRLRISIHTVRTHLKAIFVKTDIRSQAELIRRITSGPAGIVRR